MAVEGIRGCGYRKVGGLYLCGEGATMECDRLPYELTECPVCGEGVKFTRGWTWLDWFKFAGGHRDQCTCLGPPNPTVCPVCWPSNREQPYGLLWVGEAYYSPEDFIKEVLEMGVSRRIAAIPRNLKLGETWILFAHKKAFRRTYYEPDGNEGFNPVVEQEPTPGIFYAFRPQRLELLIWNSEFTHDKAVELEKKGITPIIIPDGDVDHDPRTSLLPKDEEKNAVFFDNLREKLK